MSLLPNIVGRKELALGFLKFPELLSKSTGKITLKGLKKLPQITKQMGLFTIPMMSNLFYYILKYRQIETTISSSKWYKSIRLPNPDIAKFEMYESLSLSSAKFNKSLNYEDEFNTLLNNLIFENNRRIESIFEDI
ncbi:hypothetical protein SDC9_173815 [bioreactor metagenome]|uniref:Uncharacterized protein n=1 Tax=bioreactor metagenome TaxID=1076179 RepID=A0A645GHE6_9ZZZZ